VLLIATPARRSPAARPIPSVVDPQCRVIGATRLRVIDASIMPTVVQAKVTVPALYVAGDRDLVVKFPGAQQTLANAAPQLRKHIVLPVCGHWTQQERATDVNAAMGEFLKSL